MKKAIAIITVIALPCLVAYLLLGNGFPVDPFVATYDEHCAHCHGAELEGNPPHGPALVGGTLSHGDSVAELSKIIARGVPERGMPA